MDVHVALHKILFIAYMAGCEVGLTIFDTAHESNMKLAGYGLIQ